MSGGISMRDKKTMLGHTTPHVPNGFSKSVVTMVLETIGCLSDNKNGERSIHMQGWDDILSLFNLEDLKERRCGTLDLVNV